MSTTTIDLSEESEQLIAHVGDFTIDSLAFDPSGRYLAIGTPGRVFVHDLAHDERLLECTAGDEADASARPVRLEFTADLARLVVEWNASPPHASVHSVLEVFALGTGRSQLRVTPGDGWQANASVPIAPPDDALGRRRCGWSASADGAWLAATWHESGWDREATRDLGVWDLHAGALTALLRERVIDAAVRDVTFARVRGDERLVCLVGEIGNMANADLMAFDPVGGTGERLLRMDGGGTPHTIELDPRGGRVLSLCALFRASAAVLSVWDMASGEVRLMPAPAREPIRHVATDWPRAAIYWWYRDPKRGGLVAKLVRQHILTGRRTELCQGVISAAARSADGTRWALAEDSVVTIAPRDECEPPSSPARRRRE